MLGQVDLHQIHAYLTCIFEKIEDGMLGLLAPEPLGERGPDLHYFLLGYNAFTLIPWPVKPYSRSQLTREGSIAPTGSLEQKDCGECFWNTGKQIQGPTRHNVAKVKGCQRHCFNMCCVAQHTENTPRWTKQGTQPGIWHCSHSKCGSSIFAWWKPQESFKETKHQ